jgi:hypothetical protein
MHSRNDMIDVEWPFVRVLGQAAIIAATVGSPTYKLSRPGVHD